MRTTLSRTWDPFQELENLRGLGKVWQNPNPENGERINSSWMPAVDVIENDREYVVKTDLPEVERESVKVTFENGMLTISGDRKFDESAEEMGSKYLRIERNYGRFQRSFRLPDLIDVDDCNAEFHNGVLSIHLPKKEEMKPRQIEINLN